MRNFAEVNRVLAEYVPRRGLTKNAYSLDRIKQLMEKLGNPQENYRVIHVAGTSGKTSTCYYAAALLSTGGHKTGLTISPHIEQVNERVQINMVPLPEKTYCEEISKFINQIEKLGIKPTYFELLVAFAYWYFAKTDVDYAVVEVGLGGKLDGTNVVKRKDKVCAITDIGLDHTNILGNKVEEIAQQKAGIIMPGNQVFMNHQIKEIEQAVKKTIQAKKAKLDILPRAQQYKNLPLFQQRNFSLAENAVNYLAGDEDRKSLAAQQIKKARQVTIPGRFEKIITSGKTVILDGAHNYQKLRMLFASIKEQYPNQKISVLASMTNRDKLLKESLFEIIKHSSNYLFTTFSARQDLPKKPLGQKEFDSIGGQKINFISNNKKALEKILKSEPKIVVITGSIYFVSELRPVLKAV